MEEIIEKKTGVVRLSEEIAIPCDATINTDDTFNAPIVATPGEIMYFLNPNWDYFNEPAPMIVDEESIKKVTIIEVIHATNCALCLEAITSECEIVSGIQELFFTEHEEALKAVHSIQKFFTQNNPSENWREDYDKCVTPNYRYMLKFPVKPQDILLEDSKHYVANRIIAFIKIDNAEVMYQGHDDESYENEKEVHTQHEYSGVKKQYEIVKLVEQKEQIIDI